MSQTTIPDPALRGFSACGCGCSKHQLNTYDYNSDIPGNNELSDLVEVQFKNTRKGYFRNDNHLDLQKGDVVAVEASPGHDIGTVTLTGSLVPLQMKKAQPKNAGEIKRVYRKARTSDIEKWHEARSRENDTMIQSRQIAKSPNQQIAKLSNCPIVQLAQTTFQSFLPRLQGSPVEQLIDFVSHH